MIFTIFIGNFGQIFLNNFSFCQSTQLIVYVTENGAGTKTGTSWANALDKFQLPSAVLNAPMFTEIWIAKGNENLIIRDEFNTVSDFKPIDINFSESIIAAGFKYDFDEKNTLTLQYQNFDLKNNSIDGIDYGISEFNILYSLNF